MNRPDAPSAPRVAIALLLLLAGACAVAAILCSWRVAATLFGPLPGEPSFPDDLWDTRSHLAVAALVLLGVAVVAARVRWLREFLKRRRVQNAMLVLSFGVAPLVLLEVTLAPYTRASVVSKTTIFVRDDELGWRHRPGAEDVWSEKVVRINAKGLRGPEIPYDRTPGSLRILFLGDSVTFGDGLGDDDDTLPARIAAALSDRTGKPVEAINAGVSGYSPWQEARFLRREGFRYSPDLVVVTFVLNDVTEKFGLVRFGGAGEGWQLTHTHASRIDQWLDKTNITRGVQMLAARLRFGRDTRAGAREFERLTVRSLVDFPQREDVRRAWDVTFAELDEIVGLCRERGVPLVILVSPFAFQLEREGLDAPQRDMARYAEERRVMLLDLLGPLMDHMRREQRTPQFYFIDSNHYAADGTRAVADIISAALLERGFPASLPSPGSDMGQR